MTSALRLECLLFLLFHQVYSEEPEPMFREQGSNIEMGYCFGVDYIVVYKSTLEGDLLLGNCSATNSTITLRPDLQGRVLPTQRQHLLGLQISNLTHVDSGIYRRECWKNQTLVTQFSQRLSVCGEEIEPVEIMMGEETNRTELLCNNASTGLKGTSVLWYYEMHPSYKITLFLDTSVSLEPLVKELQGVVEVRDRGTSLVLKNSVLKTIQHFHCLVNKDKTCLIFKNLYLPSRMETSEVFASKGDRVVLPCPSDGYNEHWETPQGNINVSTPRNNQNEMYISVGDKSEDFSLVFPAFTEGLIGDYTCVSTSLELQYTLEICRNESSQEKTGYVGTDISLECKVEHHDSQRVLWYSREKSGKHTLIHDSKDDTVAFPEDLRGRLTTSDGDFSLTISNLEMKDAGLYWCIDLRETVEDEEGEIDYNYDYPEGESEGDDTASDQEWDNEEMGCIFKHNIILTIKTGVPSESSSESPSEPPSEPHDGKDKGRRNGLSPDIDVTTYGIVGALVALLVVGVIIAVIVIKRRKASSQAEVI